MASVNVASARSLKSRASVDDCAFAPPTLGIVRTILCLVVCIALCSDYGTRLEPPTNEWVPVVFLLYLLPLEHFMIDSSSIFIVAQVVVCEQTEIL